MTESKLLDIFFIVLLVIAIILYGLNSLDSRTPTLTEQIALRFAETHNYSTEGYNCKNYSVDLKMIYDILNITSDFMLGCNETNATNYKCHQWLSVEGKQIEPQSGVMVNYTGVYENITENKRSG